MSDGRHIYAHIYGSINKLWGYVLVVYVDGWSDDNGDSDSNTVCVWSDIIAGQDILYQRSYIYIGTSNAFDSGYMHLGIIAQMIIYTFKPPVYTTF